MSNTLRWILAILIMCFFLAVFIISFVLYKKTPVPKGCENLEKPNEEKCRGCQQTECHFNLYYNKSDELKEDEKSTKEEEK